MRKDAGLNGDLDRIPQLAWLLFLKAFDALEQRPRGHRARLPARDRGAVPLARLGGRPGRRPHRRRAARLRQRRAAARTCAGSPARGEHDPRDVLAAVFKETYNRMLSGYLLRDVVNKVERDQLRLVRRHPHDGAPLRVDAARDARRRRRLGRVLHAAPGDPVHGAAGRPEARRDGARPGLRHRRLPRRGARAPAAAGARRSSSGASSQANLRGIEKKPLPYLLGDDEPAAARGRAARASCATTPSRSPITQIRKADRVDVVLTNPPFGGEEEKRDPGELPRGDARRPRPRCSSSSSSSASSRTAAAAASSCRTASSSATASAARIKQQLLAECNLHTIVRLPDGVFAPYTDIPSNLLFFEKTGRTKEVWFYELPPPEGRKKYSKTRADALRGVRRLPGVVGRHAREGRVENEHAWRVPIAEIEADGFNLDRKQPEPRRRPRPPAAGGARRRADRDRARDHRRCSRRSRRSSRGELTR